MAREPIIIDGVRYYADRPRSCRGCYFWKNRKLRDEAKELVIAENNLENLFASVGSEVQHQQSQREASA